jgi:UDP-N-acetylmuramate-alanine ligase
LPEETRFKVLREGKEWAEFRTPLAGMYNVKNCLGVIAVAEVIGIDRRLVGEALGSPPSKASNGAWRSVESSTA